MTLRVEQGKGCKDRYAMLSPLLLERLRNWWRTAHAQGKILTNGWLFPGLDPMDPLTVRQLNRAICAAANMALIDKRVSMHTLRHYSDNGIGAIRSQPICCSRGTTSGRFKNCSGTATCPRP